MNNTLTLLKDSLLREKEYEEGSLDYYSKQEGRDKVCARIERSIAVREHQLYLLKQLEDELSSHITAPEPNKLKPQEVAQNVYDELMLDFKPGDVITSLQLPESVGNKARKAYILRVMEKQGQVRQLPGTINKHLKFQLV